MTVAVGEADMRIRSFNRCEQESLLALWADCGMNGPGSQPRADIDSCVSNPWSELLVGLGCLFGRERNARP